MLPGPTTLVVSENCGELNVAVTVVFAFSVTRHSVAGVLGKHALDGAQLTNVAPVLGTAVRTTCEPAANVVPVGDCVIVPGPTTVVVSVTFAAKFAVATVFAFSTALHVVAVLAAQVTPLQLTNVAFALGVSASVIVVLFAKDVPAGDCVTVPGPTALLENVYFVTVVTPVPVKVAPVSTVLGPLILIPAARPPKACGANVMVIEQDAPTAIGAAVQLLVAE